MKKREFWMRDLSKILFLGSTLIAKAIKDQKTSSSLSLGIDTKRKMRKVQWG